MIWLEGFRDTAPTASHTLLAFFTRITTVTKVPSLLITFRVGRAQQETLRSECASAVRVLVRLRGRDRATRSFAWEHRPRRQWVASCTAPSRHIVRICRLWWRRKWRPGVISPRPRRLVQRRWWVGGVTADDQVVSVEDASEVAPRIGVHRNTHHRHYQRGRDGTQSTRPLAVCASSSFIRFPRVGSTWYS